MHDSGDNYLDTRRDIKNIIQGAMTGAVMLLASLSPAQAALWNIQFFESRIPNVFAGDDPANFDYQNDGIADGSGQLTADVPNGFGPVSSISISIGGTSFTDQSDIFNFGLFDNFGNPDDIYLQGFVFQPGQTPAMNTGVLSLGAFGATLNGADYFYFGIWALSSCSETICGGGDARGIYLITPASSVPLPATLPLLGVVLGSLVVLRRRERMARKA